jgi:hypothetical protein
MSGDHDLGYKQLFAHPELVRDLIAGFTGLACFRGLGPDAYAIWWRPGRRSWTASRQASATLLSISTASILLT